MTGTTSRCLRCGIDLTNTMPVIVFVDGAPTQRRLCIQHGANGANGLNRHTYARLLADEAERDRAQHGDMRSSVYHEALGYAWARQDCAGRVRDNLSAEAFARMYAARAHDEGWTTAYHTIKNAYDAWWMEKEGLT